MPLRPRLAPLTAIAGVISIFVGNHTKSPTTWEALCWFLPFTLLMWTIYWSWLYPFYISPLRHIPTVPGFPLWGQFYTIITTECGVVQRDWHSRYGGIVRYFFPFGSERLSIADDDAIRHMTVRNPYNYPKPDRARAWMRPILGDGVLLVEGETHIRQRKALTPAFSIGSIRALMPIFWTKCLHLADLWEHELQGVAPQPRYFEVLEWLNRTTLDIIGKAGLGTDVDSLDHPETALRRAYRKCFDFTLQARILHGIAAFTQLIRLIPAKANRDFQQARQAILSRASAIIKEKQEQAAAGKACKEKDIIGLIMRDNMTASAEDSLTVEAMRDQVMTFLGAGHDTTATSVAWTLLLLAKHEDVQERLRKEIYEHMPFLFDHVVRHDSERLAKVDVDSLPYLEDVTRESLRYIPSIPMTVRQAVNDDRLGQYFVPAGTIVYLLANTINRLESYWGPTANEFNPDRWRNLPNTYCTNAFMTFLQGPRGCIGRKFAEVEMKTILCSLLSKFSFKPDSTLQDPEELKMWRLVLRPRDGISLRVSLLT